MSAIPLHSAYIATPEQTYSFHDSLVGANAFYNQPNYLFATKIDLATPNALPPTYIWNTECKTVRIMKNVFSAIIFPIALYRGLQILAGKIIVPASSPILSQIKPEMALELRSNLNLNCDLKYKRLTIEVDGDKVDTLIIGTASTLGNGRWILGANGNMDVYENRSPDDIYMELARSQNANLITFNYPGVIASTGFATEQSMRNAYRAVLNFVEDKEKGIGATEVIGMGVSIGGATQTLAVADHPLKQTIKYVFIAYKTFSSLSSVIADLVSRVLGFVAKLLNWSKNLYSASKKIKAVQVIVQTASVSKTTILHKSSSLIGDGIISAESSLAKKILDNQLSSKTIVIGVPSMHNDASIDMTYLDQAIKTVA